MRRAHLAPVRAGPAIPASLAAIGHLGPGQWRHRLDIANVSRLSLFGKAQQPKGDKVADAVAADAPRPSAQRPAQRVLASPIRPSPSPSSPTTDLQNSGIGDYIDGTQAKIRQVFADQVIIARRARRDPDAGRGRGGAAAQAGHSGRQVPSVRSELLSNPGKITDYLNISPVRVDGRAWSAIVSIQAAIRKCSISSVWSPTIWRSASMA